MRNFTSYFFSALLTCVSLQAQVITNVTTGAPDSFAIASATDLANSGQPTFLSIVLTSGTVQFGSAVSKLVDGSIYGGDTSGGTIQSFTPTDGSVVTLTFNTSVNTLGYSISSFDMITGTAQNRGAQDYSVAFAAPGSGTFTFLFAATGGSTATASLEVLTHNHLASGDLATGVGALQITFHNVINEQMYREFDVTGVATSAVPEPST